MKSTEEIVKNNKRFFVLKSFKSDERIKRSAVMLTWPIKVSSRFILLIDVQECEYDVNN